VARDLARRLSGDDRDRGHRLRLPLYLGNVSTIADFGTTFAFVAIVLVWFYAIAIIILGGAIVNALRLADRLDA